MWLITVINDQKNITLIVQLSLVPAPCPPLQYHAPSLGPPVLSSLRSSAACSAASRLASNFFRSHRTFRAEASPRASVHGNESGNSLKDLRGDRELVSSSFLPNLRREFVQEQVGDVRLREATLETTLSQFRRITSTSLKFWAAFSGSGLLVKMILHPSARSFFLVCKT